MSRKAAIVSFIYSCFFASGLATADNRATENSVPESVPVAYLEVSDVDYSRSLSSLIKNGHYQFVNPYISTGRVPVGGEGKVRVHFEVVEIDHPADLRVVLEKIAQRGLRPATLAELLVYGLENPEKQVESPVVALGSRWQLRYSGEYYPYLGNDSAGRTLDLLWNESARTRWNSNYRFLAVREVRRFR